MLRNIMVIILTGLITTGAINESPAQTEGSASSFIESIGNEGISILRSTESNTQERTQRFRELLLRNIDSDAIGRFALGRYSNRMTPSQKDEYKLVFEEYMVSTYISLLGRYVGTGIHVTNEKKTLRSNIITVYSIIEIQSNAEPIHVLWKIREKNGSYKIFDVFIEGISVAITLRSEFKSAINRSRNNMDKFLEILRSRI